MEMPPLPKTNLAKSWDDPAFEGAIPAKGQRRRKEPATAALTPRPLMLCPNCHHPYRITRPDRCRCSIWDVGKS